MSARTATAAARAAAPLLAAALASLAACDALPERPRATNPLDPSNPETGGAPFDLRAAVDGHDVLLSWRGVRLAGRAGYAVYRRVAAADAFEQLGTVGPDETAYRDSTPARDGASAYRVTVFGEGGVESDIGAVGADSIDVPPLLRIGPESSGLDTTSVRDVVVHFNSPRADSVFLGDTLDAAGPSGLANGAAFAPNPNGYAWRLAAGSGGASKSVYGRVLRTDGSLSAITFDTIRTTPIRLAIAVDGHSADTVSTGRRVVDVAVSSAAGAESLEATFGAFASAWRPFAPAFAESIPGPGRRVLRVRVMNDFGTVDSVRVAVNADTLGRARIRLNAGAAQTAEGAVTVSVEDGVATAICLTNDARAADSGRAACGTLEPFGGARDGWGLDPASRGGFARVFAILANEWDTTAALVDSIFFLDDAP
jgi:hypothetical protein